MKTFDILVVGELNVDIIMNDIQGFPEIGKEIIADKLTLTLGSSSAIFASNSSALGNRVAFLGKIGTDNFADLITTALQEKKVDTSHIISSTQHATGVTIVMNYDMDRANVTFPGAMEYLSAAEVTDVALRQAKHLHVSSIFLQTGLRKNIVTLFKRAKHLGLTTSLDPQWDPAEQWDLNLNALLPYVDVFMPNTAELACLTGHKDWKSGIAALKEVAHSIVVKDGKNGAHLWNEGVLTTQDAYHNEDVVDCIGAGDSFDAGFVSEFIKGSAYSYCLEVGNIIGAINTTSSGGTAAFESLEGIKKTAKDQFSYHLKL